jgi:hypothetical protein
VAVGRGGGTVVKGAGSSRNRERVDEGGRGSEVLLRTGRVGENFDFPVKIAKPGNLSPPVSANCIVSQLFVPFRISRNEMFAITKNASALFRW